MKRIFVIFAVALVCLSQADPTFSADPAWGGPFSPKSGPSSSGSGDDFEVDVDAGVQSALDKIIGSGSAKAQSSFKSAAAAKPTQAEFSAASAAAPASAAKPSFAAVSGSAAGVAASDRMILGRPYPIDPYYPVDPMYPWYRRRLHCRVTYWPTWKICCWFTWWWWYMY